jgi:hypothetical protein
MRFPGSEFSDRSPDFLRLPRLPQAGKSMIRAARTFERTIHTHLEKK